jgi:hypothetical protein
MPIGGKSLAKLVALEVPDKRVLLPVGVKAVIFKHELKVKAPSSKPPRTLKSRSA